MAIQQLVPIYVNLKGDGAATTFAFALQNLYQFSNGAAIPFGGAGVVPTSVSVGESNFTGGTTSAGIDANGNITITFGAAVASGVVVTVRIDLTFNSGSSSSSSATQTTNVTVVGSSTVTIGAGSAVIGHVITDTGSTTAVTGTVTTSDTNLVSQGSTTSGQKGSLVQGAVTTGAPTYVTGQTSPLSLDTSGNLRVSGSFSSGALADLVGSTSALNAGGTTATINAFGYESVGVFIAAGTLAATVVPEASLDGGTTWVATNFLDPLTNATVASFVLTNPNAAQSASIVTVGGASNYRVRVSAFTSGTANATLRANAVTNNTTIVTQPTAANLNATVVQGTGSNLHTVLDSGTLTSITNAVTMSPLADATTAISLTAVTQTAQVLLAGRAAASFEITSVGTGGQLICEASVDGSNWFGVDVWSEFLETWIQNSNTQITTTGRWWFEPLGALNAVRVRVTAITSGTITGTMLADSVPMGTFEFQGSAGQAFPPNQIAIAGTDGTNMRAVQMKQAMNTTLSANVPTFTTAGAGASDPAVVTIPSPNSGVPVILQKASQAGTSTQASLSIAFASNNVAGNSIVVVVGVGNTGAIKITDTQGNPYGVATIANNGTFSTAIFYATNIAAGANTVTVTPSATVSLDIAIYEVQGMIGPGGVGFSNTAQTAPSTLTAQQAQPDVTATGTGTAVTSVSITSGNNAPLAYPNELGFAALGISTAQNPTVFNPWRQDFNLQGTTPTNILTLSSYSTNFGGMQVSPTLNATITSANYVACLATFKPMIQAVGGTMNALVQPSSFGGNAVNPSAFIVSAATPSLIVAGAHNLYGMVIQNLLTTITSTGTQYVKFYDSATGAGAASTNYKFTIVLTSPPAAGTSGILSIPPGALALANFTSGIVVSISTTSASTTTTGQASSVGTFWYQ